MGGADHLAVFIHAGFDGLSEIGPSGPLTVGVWQSRQAIWRVAVHAAEDRADQIFAAFRADLR